MLLSIKDSENVVTRQKPYMFCTHLSSQADPHLRALRQAAGSTDPSQVCAPLPGQELPPTLPRSPVLLPGSTNNPASPPRETQPERTTENIKHLLRKLYSRWGEDFGAPGTGEKKQALRHMHPLPDLKWQQGTLLWIRRKAYMPRNVSVYSNYNITSLIKATASLHKLHLAQCGYTSTTSISWQVSQYQYGEWLL